MGDLSEAICLDRPVRDMRKSHEIQLRPTATDKIAGNVEAMIGALSQNQEKIVKGHAKAHGIIRTETQKEADRSIKSESKQNNGSYPLPHSQPGSVPTVFHHAKHDHQADHTPSHGVGTRQEQPKHRNAEVPEGERRDDDHGIDRGYSGPDVVYEKDSPVLSAHQNQHPVDDWKDLDHTSGRTEGTSLKEDSTNRCELPALRPVGRRHHSLDERPLLTPMQREGNVNDDGNLAKPKHSGERGYAPMGGFPTGSGQAGRWS